MAVLIGFAEYTFIFKEWIAQKNDLISQKDNVISVLKDKLKLPAAGSQPPSTPATSGSATASGAGAVANTGSGNTFNPAQPLPPKPS